MIHLSLLAHLLTLEPLTAIVGQRIYPDLSPQGAALPRLVLRLMPGAERTYHSTGASGMVFADIEAAIQGTDVVCGQIYEVLRAALDKFDGDWNGTDVEVSRITPPFSRPAFPIHGDETGVPSLVAMIEVTYRES